MLTDSKNKLIYLAKLQRSYVKKALLFFSIIVCIITLTACTSTSTNIKLASLTFSKNTPTRLVKGESVDLKLDAQLENPNHDLNSIKLKWSILKTSNLSTDEAKLEVDASTLNAKLIAKTAGEVIISVEGGGKSAELKVIIKSAISSIPVEVEERVHPMNVVVNVIEPSEVTFTIQIFNPSAVNAIELTTIINDRNNDGTVDATYNASDICSTASLLPSRGTLCQFSYGVTGKAKEVIKDKVTINGNDSEGDIISIEETVDLLISDFKLVTLDGQGFGSSIAIDKNIIVVADPFDHSNGANSGSIYIYEQSDNGNWSLVKKILALDGATRDNFGSSIGISENTIVVGANRDDDKGGNSGSAYIFERDKGGANNWGQTKKILASNGKRENLFGSSVAIVKDTVVIGAYARERDSGAIYIFERNNGGINNWGQTKEILPSDTGHSKFGQSVAMTENTIIVGAPNKFNDGIRSGSVHIFERNKGGANNWGRIKEVAPSNQKDFTQFGYSIAISESTIVVGAFYDDAGEGAAYIYERNNGGINNWGQIKKIVASDEERGLQASFGQSVAISGNIIIVGAPEGENNDGWTSGAVYVFERGNNNNWRETNKMLASDGAGWDGFGFSVSMSGNTMTVAAPRDDSTDNNGSMGSVYVYE